MSDFVHADPDLPALVSLFHNSVSELGQMTSVSATEMPEPYRSLLAHEHHMTVTVEEFHGCLVDVQVLQARIDGDQYLRQILLHRQSDHAVVQYGIVRLDLQQITGQARADILSQKIPLGRVLIKQNVLRTIHLSQLWRIAAGPDLAKLFSIPLGTVTYGRTAAILTDSKPAIELLEIVTPVVV